MVIDDIDNQGQLVHELVRLSRGYVGGDITHQRVYHAPQNAARDPDVAVDDPDDLPGGLAISPADVSYLGIRPQHVDATLGAVENGVLGLDQDLRIVGGKVFDQLLENRICRVARVLYTQPNRDLLTAVVLAKGRSNAFV